jgi:hypothetical protein
MRIKVSLVIISVFFVACDMETDTLPKADVPKIDSSKIKLPKNPDVKPHVLENEYAAYEIKLKNLPQIVHANTDRKSMKKSPLKTKIVDKKNDTLFSVKFGQTIDTNFVSEYEFYINKKSKEISVYDKGEDRMIPLSEWQKMNE